MTDVASHFRPDPKRVTKRTRQNRDAWQVLRDRVLKLDRVCVVCQQRPSESVHHVVPRDFSGDDGPHNLIGVCGTGITRCHGLIEARDPWACERVREVLDVSKPLVLRYVLDTAGQAWLDDRYPLAESPATADEAAGERAPEDAPPKPSRWAVPVPRTRSRHELDELYRDCLLILKAMDAPVVERGKGEMFSAVELVMTDFRDRYGPEHLKGASA